MGGVGKSALAAEAVARLSDDRATFPGGAAWISCEGLEGADGLAEVWSRVARALSLDAVTAQADPEARRAALAQSLAARPRTLLALDNVEPKLDADALLDTLAITGHTALLLTARDAVAPNRLSALTLAPLPDPDAAILFAQILHRVALPKGDERPTRDDEASIPALVDAVGGLPLAIELTAAYAGVQRLPLAAIKAEIDADHLNAAAFRADPKRAPTVRFDRSWRILTPAQQRTFAALSLPQAASFRRSVGLALAKRANGDGTLLPEADARSSLSALVAYALVEALPGGDLLRLHPLLREFARQKLVLYSREVRDKLFEGFHDHSVNDHLVFNQTLNRLLQRAECSVDEVALRMIQAGYPVADYRHGTLDDMSDREWLSNAVQQVADRRCLDEPVPLIMDSFSDMIEFARVMAESLPNLTEDAFQELMLSQAHDLMTNGIGRGRTERHMNREGDGSRGERTR